jgi:hypothetical protein
MSEKHGFMVLGPAVLAVLVYGSPALAEEPTEPESTVTADDREKPYGFRIPPRPRERQEPPSVPIEETSIKMAPS